VGGEQPIDGVAGPVEAEDASLSFLRTPDEIRAVIEAAGFRLRAWEGVTVELGGASAGTGAGLDMRSALPRHALRLDKKYRPRAESRLTRARPVRSLGVSP
jgi:hypothetical protein